MQINLSKFITLIITHTECKNQLYELIRVCVREFQSENLKEREHLVDLSADGRKFKTDLKEIEFKEC